MKVCLPLAYWTALLRRPIAIFEGKCNRDVDELTKSLHTLVVDALNCLCTIWPAVERGFMGLSLYFSSPPRSPLFFSPVGSWMVEAISLVTPIP